MISADLIRLVSQLAAPAFFDMLAVAGLGALLPAVVAEAVGMASGRVFADKFAQQMARMFTTFMAVAAIAFLGGAVLLSRSLPWLQGWLTSPQSPALPAMIAWGAALLLGGIYAFTFRSMRSGKVAHLLLGLLGALAALAAIPLFLALCPALLHAFTTGEPPVAAPLAVPGPDSLLWPFVLQYVLLAPALAGGLGTAYLVYRRNRDDYGRDYYNYALPAAARWGAPFMALQNLGMAWLLFMLAPADRVLVLGSSLGPLICGAGALTLICAAAWFVVMRSKTPMRLKGLILTSGLLAWAAYLAAGTVAFVLLPAA